MFVYSEIKLFYSFPNLDWIFVFHGSIYINISLDDILLKTKESIVMPEKK